MVHREQRRERATGPLARVFSHMWAANADTLWKTVMGERAVARHSSRVPLAASALLRIKCQGRNTVTKAVLIDSGEKPLRQPGMRDSKLKGRHPLPGNTMAIRIDTSMVVRLSRLDRSSQRKDSQADQDCSGASTHTPGFLHSVPAEVNRRALDSALAHNLPMSETGKQSRAAVFVAYEAI
ncbi:MAG: hypothetical protein NVSMB22_14060 [Chloroflexota bacterium]